MKNAFFPASIRNHRPVIILFVIFAFAMNHCMTPSIRVTREQNLGDALFNQYKYAEAIDHYERMLDASRKLGIYRNISMESEVCRKIANGYEMTGNYEAALTSVRKARELDSVSRNIPGVIEDYRHEGMIHVYMGSYFSGVRFLEKALERGEGMNQSLKNTNRLILADIYLALAQLYAVMGRSDSGLDYANKSLNIFRQTSDKKGEMESYLILGTIFSDQGDMPAAKNFTERSLRIAEEIGMGTSRHSQLLAVIALSTGGYEDALRYQQQALDEAVKYGIAAQVIWATVGLGDIYSELGDYQQAAKLYEEAKEKKDTMAVAAGGLEASLGMRMGDITRANSFFTSQGSVTGRGISLIRMSRVLVQSNKNDSALIFLAEAGRDFRETGNRQGLARVHVIEGKILVDAGSYKKADIVLDSALKNTEFPETLWQAWYQKGRLYEKMNLSDNAIEAYMKSVDIIEKIRGNLTVDELKSTFFNSKREVYDRLINVLINNKRPLDAFRFSEQARARAFYDILVNKKIDFRGSVPGDLISLEQEKRIEMSKLYKLLYREDVINTSDDITRNSDIRQIKEALAAVQEEYEEIIRQIKLSNPSYAEIVTAEPVSLSEIRSLLPDKAAVMEFWISENELITWLITSGEVTSFKTSIDAKGLDNMIERARRAIQSNALKESDMLLSTLYDLIIAPAGKFLTGYRDIIVIPNGSLHFLPFQALRNQEGRYFVEDFNISYSPSASVWMVCIQRESGAGDKFMGLALSDISVENKPGLPGTEDEVRKILPLFRDNISAFGKQATETFVKKNISDCNFIHFATHGSYNYRQPLYSCLLFPPGDEDDGRLNVYEVLEMNLNSRLVTLSACETGLGNVSQGDELTGLSRAFLFAGSSSVLVSLWSVADYPTALLMTNFYTYLKEYPASEALTMAQRDVLKEFRQPLYWSPFILIGNGNITIE